MSLSNATPFAALAVPWVDPQGVPIVIAIVKATYALDARGRFALAGEPAPVRVEDEPFDPEATDGSLRHASDVGAPRPGTGLVVLGDAVATTRTTFVDVTIAARDRVIPIRVHGDRPFVADGDDPRVGPALPLERVPLVWERAYGGTSASLGVVDLRNPAGVGVADALEELEGTPAPQIERPDRPHRKASDAHEPVGCLSVPRHWEPRRTLAGTFDAAWVERRMPIAPADADPRAEQIAHPSLVFDPPLRGGDAIAVSGMRAAGPLRVELPTLGVVIRALFDGASAETRPTYDTVLVEPETGRVEIVMRAAFPRGRARRILREIRIDTETP